jgi:DNA-binding CsgD family transcriptional regulator
MGARAAGPAHRPIANAQTLAADIPIWELTGGFSRRCRFSLHPADYWDSFLSGPTGRAESRRRQGFGRMGMILGSLDAYGEDRVAAISQNIAAAIDAATFGSGAWDRIPAILSEAFPGSFGGLYNMNFPESRLNFLSWQNMDPAFVTSFAEHFAYINPWAAYWTPIKGTTIAASEEVYPARNFAKSEFYNDWLQPQDGAEAAAGMKVVGERDEAVHVLLHYPLSTSGIYDRAAVEVLNRIRGNLERSVNLARLLRTDVEMAVAEAALVERSRCAAFIVGGDRRLREANPMAERLLSAGQAVSVRNGRCHLADKDADARLGAALEKLSKGLPTLASRIAFRTATGAWQVSVATLPFPQSPVGGSLALLPPHRMILVLVVDLGVKGTDAGDLAPFTAIFGLTPAEIAFCRRMLLGESVTDAADQLGITQGTARTRLKAILQKTDTSRQAELMLLLAKAG